MQALLKKLLKLGVIFLFLRNILASVFFVCKETFYSSKHVLSRLHFFHHAMLGIKQYALAIKNKYNTLSHFQQKFSSSFFIGLVCYCLFSFFQNSALIKDITNKAFDNTLIFYTDYAQKNSTPSAPIYIGIDEESFQDLSWSQGDTTQLDLSNILQIVDTAFKKGSRHVFVDMQKYSSTQLPALEKFIAKYQHSAQTKHLYMVVPFKPDPCLPTVPFKRQLQPSILDKLVASRPTHKTGNGKRHDQSLIFGSLYIHPVTPSYYESADKIIRFWQLFGVYQTQQTGTHSWAFLPSPQLAYHVVTQIENNHAHKLSSAAVRRKLNELTWLHAFEYSPHKTIANINHTDYSASVFEKLVKVSKSKMLPRYCLNDRDCLQQHFSRSQSVSAADAFNLSNDLSSKIAHKGSAHCIQAVDDFSQVHHANAARSDIMQNRIVYSMRSWREDSNEHNQNYQMFTPLQLVDNNQKARLEPSWQDKFVVIGAEFLRSGDANYLTPIGNMSGAMINLNAMVSFNNFGAIGLIGTLKKHLLNVLLILLVSLLIARFNAKVAVLTFTITLVVVILFLYKWMFHNGVWIEFGLPVFVINVMQLIIEFLEKKKLKAHAEH